AQISPCRLTIDAHSIFPEKKPPASPPSDGACRSSFFRSAADGRSRQLAAAPPARGPRLASAADPGCVSAGLDARPEPPQPAAASARHITIAPRMSRLLLLSTSLPTFNLRPFDLSTFRRSAFGPSRLPAFPFSAWRRDLVPR